MWFIFNRLQASKNESWYVVENNSFPLNTITHVFSTIYQES
jgi:hypothetical protein